jgi:processive 1,2-diacylglycerol beta-glucosyltransferase
MGDSRDVLVLSAGYGSGHNQVAEAIRHALTAAGAESVSVIDHFSAFVHPAFLRVTRSVYLSVLKSAPGLWGMAYALSDRLPVESPLLLGVNRLGKRSLADYLIERRPAVAVSVHPTPAGATSALKEEGFPILHVTVFTDFVAHTQWIYPGVERYCVPCEEVAEGLRRRGVPLERIAVTGIPIHERFLRPLDREALRAKYRLLPELPVVLVMGGAHGGLAGPGEVLQVLASVPIPCQGLVVCGRDRALARRLSRRAGSRVRVFGHVDAVEELMALADVLVTKAGAVTLSEAMAMELPMVLYHSIPGQERANQRYLEEAGAAVTARGRAELAHRLGELLSDEPLREKLKENLRRITRPDSAGAVAREVLALTR